MVFKSAKVKQIRQSDLYNSVVDLAKYTEDEFAQVASAFQADDPFTMLFVAPKKPRTGMLVYADGTHWNPGFGEGFYEYTSKGVWTPLTNFDKAWASVTPGASPVITGGSNVASVTKNGTGDYTFSFTVPFANTHYVVSYLGEQGTSTNGLLGAVVSGGRLVGSCRIITFNISGTASEPTTMLVKFAGAE